MLKGVPRYGGGHWGGIKAFTPDAEITVGRIAMLVRFACGSHRESNVGTASLLLVHQYEY